MSTKQKQAILEIAAAPDWGDSLVVYPSWKRDAIVFEVHGNEKHPARVGIPVADLRNLIVQLGQWEEDHG